MIYEKMDIETNAQKAYMDIYQNTSFQKSVIYAYRRGKTDILAPRQD